jgi:uncharacterized protein (TIRG00374 family)
MRINKTLGNVLKFVFFLGLGIFLVWLITHKLTPGQWRRIREAFRDARYWYLVPGCLIGCAGFLLRGLRWRLLIMPLGYKTGVFTIFSAVMIGYIANLAVPRLGEITRCGMISRYERLPVNKVIGTMVTERTTDVLCLILIMAFTVLTQIRLVGHFFYVNVTRKILAFFTDGDPTHHLLIGGTLVAAVAAIWLVLRLCRHARWRRHLHLALRGVRAGILSVKRMRQKKLFILYTLLIWVTYLSMIYFGFLCFSATSTLGLWPSLSVLSFGSVGMIITQGGIGAYQLIVQKVLLLYGVAEIYGFAFGWLSWLAQTLLVLVVGFICVVSLPFLKRRQITPLIAARKGKQD